MSKEQIKRHLKRLDKIRINLLEYVINIHNKAEFQHPFNSEKQIISSTKEVNESLEFDLNFNYQTFLDEFYFMRYILQHKEELKDIEDFDIEKFNLLHRTNSKILHYLSKLNKGV